ncbi:MAG: MBL fold metallo-hydrolase, partial [Clostridia bacterium]
MYITCSKHVVSLPLASPNTLEATTNTYIIADQNELFVVDPGYDYAENTVKIVQTIETFGNGNAKVAGIIFTHYHPDHAPGARGLAKHYDCPLYCHEAEANLIDRMIQPLSHTDKLHDGGILRLGSLHIEVLHTPGHTPGHIALFIREDELLLTGDTVISQGSTWIGPPDGHMGAYLQSLQKLKKFPAKRIGPGHGPVIDEPEKAIDWFISRRLEREAQIASLVQQWKQASVVQLVEEIYAGQVHPDKIWVAEKTVLAHLIKLVEDGKMSEISDDRDGPDKQR